MTQPIAELLDELCVHADAERSLRLRSHPGDIDATLAGLGDEAERRVGTDLKRALVATEVIVELADELGRPSTRARARRARAYALSFAGRFQDALPVSRSAAALADDDGAVIEAARARLGSMQALAELGRLDEAVEAGELARSALADAGEPALAGRADINLGLVHLRRDDARRAVEIFDRARPLLDADRQMIGYLENSRGEALVILNDFDGAEAAYAAALEAFRSADALLMSAIAEGNLAELATRRGQLQRALFHFERARRHLETDASGSNLARVRAEQAHAMAALGMPREALREFEDVLPELDRLGLTGQAAEARGGMGRAMMQIGGLAEAETALAAAATAYDELGNATQRARIDLVRAELAAANGRLSEATGMVFAALARLHDKPADLAAARLVLARLSMEQGSLHGAEADLIASLELAQRLDLPALLADVLDVFGRLRLEQGRPDEAIDLLRSAAAQIERIRASLQAERFRAAYLGDRLHTYGDLLRTLVERGAAGDVEEAFAVSERARCRSLLDQLGGFAFDDDPAAAGDDTAARELRDRVIALQSELNVFYSKLADTHGAASAGVRAELARRERELDQLSSRLAATRGAVALLAPAADAEQVRAALPDDATLVQFCAVGESIGAFVVDTGGVRWHGDLIDAKRLDDLRHRLRFQMNRGLRPGGVDGSRGSRLLQDVRRELQSLHGMMDPLDLDGDGPLVIVPCGQLHLIPFGALYDGARHLIERRPITTVPSASVYAELCARQTNGGESAPAVLVGVADEHAPQVDAEIAALGRVLPDARRLVGSSATLEAVRAAVADASIVHLACHGRFVSTTPMLSGLRLHDRWLTIRDLYGTRLRADLVVLSGCETGLSRVQAGDELVGLLRGFLAAGARSMLVSMWRVDDAVTASMMELLHDGLAAKGLDHIASTVRSMQLEVMNEYPHPAHWAPFILVGQS